VDEGKILMNDYIVHTGYEIECLKCGDITIGEKTELGDYRCTICGTEYDAESGRVASIEEAYEHYKTYLGAKKAGFFPTKEDEEEWKNG